MEVHTYSVKAKSKADNIRVNYIMIIQKAKADRKSARDLRNLGNLCIMLEIQQQCLGPRESAAGATYLSLTIFT